MLSLLFKENLSKSKSIESPHTFPPIISEAHITCSLWSLFLKFSLCCRWSFECETAFPSCNSHYTAQQTGFSKIFYDSIFTNTASQCATAFIYSLKFIQTFLFFLIRRHSWKFSRKATCHGKWVSSALALSRKHTHTHNWKKAKWFIEIPIDMFEQFNFFLKYEFFHVAS